MDLQHFTPSPLPRRTVLAALAASCASGLTAPAQAAAKADTSAAWPSQPVTLVVGFSKGSVSDILASTLAEPLAQLLGQPVTIDTVPGKAGTLATAKVAQSTDGHSIGLVMGNTLTVAKMIDPSLSYDPERDLRPVAFLSDDPMVLVTASTDLSPNATRFLGAMRTGGESWKFGSQGVGSIGHLCMEYLAVKAGLHPQHVPMTGGPEVVEALRAGKVQVAVLPATLAKRNATPQGGLKAVAVTSHDRSALLPDVPSLHESGVTGFDYRVWSVAVVPRKWPDAQAERLSAVLAKLMSTPEIRKKLAAAGLNVPADTSANQARREIAHEAKLLGGIAAIQGVKVSAAAR